MSFTKKVVPEAEPVAVAQPRPRLTHRLIEMLKRHPKKTVALTGLAMTVVYHHYNKQDDVDKNKKKVLVLPFYKMNIVEQTKPDFRSLSRFNNSNKVIEMPVDELVHLIHEAAQDPNIVALYGIFGNGHGFNTGGWAHIEEIRNALFVFQQSHRCHKEPRYSKDNSNQQQRSRKPLYAYANTFASPLPGADGMKEYYLATAFTHIHLQSQGDLNLFGLHATNTFWKDFLQKYGVRVDVFKHGLYKNFANQFTHARYSKEHKENVQNILHSINHHVCDGIYTSRNSSLKNFEFSNFWKMVHRAGSFPADIAHKIGFIDYLPRVDPLDHLVASNKTSSEDSTNETLKQTWGKETDMEHFTAEAKISITDYARQKKQDEERESRQWKLYKKLRSLADQSSGIQLLFSSMGYAAPYYNIPKTVFSETKAKGLDEKIAVIKIGGAITEDTARKTVKALRKLKNSKDVKAVVLRVDSPGGAVTACETIYQEIQDLPQKVVVSFGNVSASGGYYISSNAERIFASPTTITGSIGVFMIRLDLRGLAKQYGITFDSVATSDMSGSFDPFYPINHRMRDNFANYTDRVYMHFKSLVGAGRNMDLDMVETVAQGRVWTGEQAKHIGLVDELGGLDRAIAYCQRNHTSGQAVVVSWPPKQSLFQFLMKRRNNNHDDDFDDLQVPSILQAFFASTPKEAIGISNFLPTDDGSVVGGGPRFPLAMSGLMLTADENWGIRCLLQDNDFPDILSQFPPGFWE